MVKIDDWSWNTNLGDGNFVEWAMTYKPTFTQFHFYLWTLVWKLEKSLAARNFIFSPLKNLFCLGWSFCCHHFAIIFLPLHHKTCSSQKCWTTTAALLIKNNSWKLWAVLNSIEIKKMTKVCPSDFYDFSTHYWIVF